MTQLKNVAAGKDAPQQQAHTLQCLPESFIHLTRVPLVLTKGGTRAGNE